MKKILLMLTACMAALAGCNDFVDPINYNDKIISINDKAVQAYEAYNQLAENTSLQGDFSALDKKRIETMQQVEVLKNELSDLSGFEGDTNFKNAALKNLDTLIGLMNQEGKQLIELWEKMGKEKTVTETEKKQEANLLSTIANKNNEIYKELSRIQENFAKKHGYELEPELNLKP